VSDQVGLSHCQYDSLVTVWDEARLRQGHNDQSSWGHQCSETMLTGESRFHTSTPLGIEPGSLMTGSKQVDHRTSGTVCETSLTGESWFHISTNLGIEPGSLMMGSRRLDHWTSGTVCECCEVAGSPQSKLTLKSCSLARPPFFQIANSYTSTSGENRAPTQ
jgi:hypothetical protein